MTLEELHREFTQEIVDIDELLEIQNEVDSKQNKVINALTWIVLVLIIWNIILTAMIIYLL